MLKAVRQKAIRVKIQEPNLVMLLKLALLCWTIICFGSGTSLGDDSQKHSAMKTEHTTFNIAVAPSASPTSCKLTIQISNPGTDPISVFVNEGILECKLEIRDADGELCPYTPKGQIVMGDGSGSMRPVKILPGESRELSISLEKYFALKVGKWSLECKVLLSKKRNVDLIPAGKLDFFVIDVPNN